MQFASNMSSLASPGDAQGSSRLAAHRSQLNGCRKLAGRSELYISTCDKLTSSSSSLASFGFKMAAFGGLARLAASKREKVDENKLDERKVGKRGKRIEFAPPATSKGPPHQPRPHIDSRPSSRRTEAASRKANLFEPTGPDARCNVIRTAGPPAEVWLKVKARARHT